MGSVSVEISSRKAGCAPQPAVGFELLQRSLHWHQHNPTIFIELKSKGGRRDREREMRRHCNLSLTTVCLLLLSPADCQRNGRLTTQRREPTTRSREDTRAKESREISFGGLKPIPGGKGLRFPDPGGFPDPGEQDRKELQVWETGETTTATTETTETDSGLLSI